MKTNKLSLKSKGLSVYLFLMLGLALFGNLGYQGLNQMILWLGGPLLVLWIVVPNINKIKDLPYEYWAYLSLALFGFIGFYKVIDVDGFLRYQQVLIANFVLMILVYFTISNEWEWILVWKTIFIVGVFVALQSFLTSDFYSAGGFRTQADDFARLEGLTGNANGTANYARVSMIAALLILQTKPSRPWVYLIVGAILFLFYVILITASRGSFVNMSFVLGAFLVLRYFSGWRFLVLVSILFFLSNVIFVWAESFLKEFYLYERLTRFNGVEETVEGDYRFILLAKAWELFLNNPVLGVGLNQFKIYSGGKISHTDFLDILAQLGFLAGIFYMSIYVRLFRRLWRLRNWYAGMKINKIFYVLLICFCSELLYGLSNPNWFSQLQMVVLSLLTVGATKIFFPSRFLPNYPNKVINETAI